MRIIEITDGPIGHISKTRELPGGEIGEIIVQAPSTTREYFRRPDATAQAKIADDEGRFWHRMGDVGWRGDDGRLWFCGRKAHIVETARGRMFSIPCEAIFNEHPRAFRSALVGVGERGQQRPVIIVEPEQSEFPTDAAARKQFTEELLELGRANVLTESIDTVLFRDALPVDIRHNVKIFREKLVPWAEDQLRKSP